MENPPRQRPTSLNAAFDPGNLARLVLLICLGFAQGIAAAQTTPRDYAISPPPVRYSADGGSAIVTFTVTNQGGDAAEVSRIVITENQSKSIAYTETLPPLAAGQAQSFSIPLPLRDLPEGDVFFRIEAGIDAYELAGSPIARNNEQLFRINKAAAPETAGAPTPAQPRFDFYLPIVNLGINFHPDGIQLNDSRYSSSGILASAGLLAAALFCLWLLSIVLRLIFRRPPEFDVWQPPYAPDNWHDPNSAPGRRHSWQFHAQNSALSAPNAPDQLMVIKRLLDKRGVVLGAWKIKAMRTVQYDVYGRINRTEALMPRKVINQLNRVIGRAPSYDNQELQQAVAPIARRICSYTLSPVEKQNLMLPIALEIRFEGQTDEIRIQFELYQYRDSAWHLIDHWAPAFGQVGEHVPEQFTFSLNGQLSGESRREFKGRLREDLTQLLAGLFDQHQLENGAHPPASDASGRKQAFANEEKAGYSSTLDDETDPNTMPKH